MERKAARKYLARVKRGLLCGGGDRIRLLRRAEEMADGLLQEDPEAGYRELEAAFGPPDQFAREMLEGLDGNEVAAHWRRRRLLRRCGLVGLALILVLTSCFLYYKLKESENLNNGFVVVIGPAENITENEYDDYLKAQQESQTSN